MVLTLNPIFILFAQTPELVYQIGHSDDINSVAISSDGKFAVSGSRDMTIKLWELESGRLIRTFISKSAGSLGGIDNVIFSPDGKSILSSGFDAIHLWETSSGTLLKTFKAAGTSSIAFSPDGQHFIAGGRDKKIKLWDINRGNLIRIFEKEKSLDEFRKKTNIYVHTGGVTSVAYSSNGQYILAGGEEGSVALWEIATGKLLKFYDPQIRQIRSVDISPDCKYGIIGGENSCVKKIELFTGATQVSLPDSGKYITEVKYSMNGQYFLATKSSGVVEIRQSCDTKLVQTLKLRKEDLSKRGMVTHSIFSAAFTPDNKYVLTGGNGLLLWKIDDGKIIRHFESNHSPVSLVSFSPHEHTIVFTANDSVLKLLDLSKNKLFSMQDQSSFINSISFSPDGRSVLTGSKDQVNLWSLDQKQISQSLGGHQKSILATAFSADGNYAYSLSDTLLKTWDVKNGELKDEIEMSFKSPLKNQRFLYIIQDMHLDYHHRIIAFSPNSNYILSDSSLIRPFDDEFFKKKELISISKSGLKLWNTSSGEFVKLFNKWHSGVIRTIVFSPDGNLAISGGDDKIIKIWDVHKGKEIRTLKGHTSVITDLKFSPDGQMILSGSGGIDRTIKLWNASNGKLLRTFAGHQAGINSISFSPDGKQFVSASWDKTIKLWNVENSTEVATFFFFDGNDWVVIAPDGRFDGTPERLKELYYVQGLEIIPIDAFFEKSYTPGLLAELLSGDKEHWGVPAINFTQQIKLPPRVEILSPPTDQTYTTDNINISVKVTDQGGGIDEIRLYQNGKLINQTQRGFKPDTNTEKVIDQDFEVMLVPGLNEFRATAFNSDRTEAVPDRILLELTTPKPTADLYIITVGLNEYKNANYNLNYGKPDAVEFLNRLEKQGRAIFKKIVKLELYDKEATRNNIIAAFEEFSNKSRPEDVFVFFYAGHGVMSENDQQAPSDYYLALHDVVNLFGNETALAVNGISATELRTFSTKIKAQKQLFVLDACQAGSAVNMFALRGASEEKAMIQLARSAGIMLLASSGNNQYASEFGQLGHGVFTYALLEGLAGKADGGAKDGKITVKELEAYLNDAVPQLTQKYRGVAQYPNSYTWGQDFPLGVVK